MNEIILYLKAFKVYINAYTFGDPDLTANCAESRPFKAAPSAAGFTLLDASLVFSNVAAMLRFMRHCKPLSRHHTPSMWKFSKTCRSRIKRCNYRQRIDLLNELFIYHEYSLFECLYCYLNSWQQSR